MAIHSLVPSNYYPTSPRSGNEGPLVFRMSNMILRGTSERPYSEVYSGSLDLNETIPTSNITGTVACTINVTQVVGTGTVFKTELHLGQRLEVFGGAPNITIPLVVDFITDDTHFTACRAPYASTTGATCTRLPRLQELNKKRASFIWGSAVEYDLGNIIAVGDGTLRLNGAVLGGTSLTLSRKAKIAIFDSTTGNYSVAQLGIAAPAALTAAEAGGGTKNMQPGDYSIRACQARIATRGYSNPSPKAEVTLTVAGNLIKGTFPARSSADIDAWLIFVTLAAAHQDTDGLLQGINGPWWRYQPNAGLIYVKIGAGAGEIAAAGGTYNIDYNDAEVAGNDLLSFNNDAPPDAEFLTKVGGTTVYISTDGPGNTSPGPFIAPAKSFNIEAAPAGLRVSPSPPDTIIGFKVAPQRLASGDVAPALYLLCVNTLQIATVTGTDDFRLPPLAVAQFWSSGFKNPDCLLFVDSYLIGMTNHGLARSLAFGDASSEEFGFASAMVELFQTVNPGHCLLALDPINNAACLFESGHSRNAQGFWTTRVWMYGMRENKWIGDILLSDDSHDMIVCGAATVNGQLEFLAGGRTSTATTVVKTYRWDTPNITEDISYYLAWQFSDWGIEDRPKHVGPFFQVVGQQSGGFGEAGIYGAEPGDAIPVAALEAGDNTTSKSGTIFLISSDPVTQQDAIELNIDNLKQFTVRVGGRWFGGAGLTKDRIDEVLVEATAMGARR